MYTLLRHQQIGEPSCSKLVRALREMDINLVKTDGYSDDFRDTDVLIRWGHDGDFPLKSSAIEFNTVYGIQNGANKKRARRLLQEHGVSVPKSWFSKSVALNDLNLVFPLIGRPSYHTQGQNVEFIENRFQLVQSNSTYWSEFIPKEKEYRVYVFGNDFLGVVEKIPQDSSKIAWNSCLGATFVDVEKYPLEIVSEAIKAAKVIGQYFSGVDLMLFNGKPYILELNSSLALSNPHRVDIFAGAIKNTIDYYNRTGLLQ